MQLFTDLSGAMPIKDDSMDNQITVRPSDPQLRSLRAARLQLSTQEQVGQALDQLLGSYPLGRATNPEIYIAAVTAVLADYPASVIAKVTHPVHGIPSKCKFLPTIAELKENLDLELAREIRANKQREKTEARMEISADERERMKRKFTELSRSLETGERTFVK